MNREQKAQRYDWLLNQYKGIERQINNVEKLPLEETLQDINSTEYTPGNLAKVNHLKNQLRQIDEEVKRLY
jgi:polyhydroxyalkanoate synthesis regulator phasin|tara:strand:- start:2646 stop:2858 length:213 start_codon:yes stop_codon:yes gene_type:complete